ncbi:hypothetical protein L207DRAFT_468538 [Hyaloscypha variabilis F]|uniref:Uncharacterized protein n=1 Tax=Hyaloscypha variabilis (strain UAMH 11265 / GT02V1 / F) TaxID=1149755 RepID=A0A2J6R719_HYAVF|nr:hypothetical protein L207DRAFT_468538 [Hyaloscypha variabilis F]
MIVTGVAAGIGLVSESIHHHNEKKAAQKAAAEQSTHSSDPPTYSQSTSSESIQREAIIHEEGDEEQWDLDDAQDHLPSISVEAGPKKRPFERDPMKITQHFIDDYPVQPGHTHGRLALPVVLPQRRPKDRSRGFIRAYAPVLMSCGIDQAMFLDFLETFNLASQANPWINAINLAGFAFMALPTGISQAASLALMIAVKVVSNMDSRKRYNSFLDKINDDFYRPRGLYCMMLTWDPESPDLQVGVNTAAVDSMIASNVKPPEGIAQKTVHKLRPSMGKTNGVCFTETAPLVFPKLDELNARSQHSTEERTTKEKLKSAGNFVGEYFDRRAQAKYAAENPDSQLVVGPKPTFTSRLADPNNPANHGDILALLSGGYLSTPMRGGFGGGLGGRGFGYAGQYNTFGARGDMFAARQGALDERMAMSGYGREYQNQPYSNQQYSNQANMNQQYGVYGRVGFGGPQVLADGVKRILRHHVLYLLIVKMPSDAEMDEAKAFMAGQHQQA